MQFPCIAYHSGESLSWGRRKRHERLLEKEYWRYLDSSHLSWGSLPFVILMNANSHKKKGRRLKGKKTKTECKYQLGVLSPGWVSALSAGVLHPLSHWIPCLTLCTCLTVAQRTRRRPRHPGLRDQKHTVLYGYVQLALISIRYTYIAAYANTYSTYMILHTSMTNLRHSKSESG